MDIPGASKLPPALDRLGVDARAGMTFVKDNTGLAYGDGLLNKIKDSHEAVVSAVTYLLEDIAKYPAEQGSAAVTLALHAYESADRGAVTRLDDAGRAVFVDRTKFSGYYRMDGDPTSFTDAYEPQGRYKATIADYNKADQFQYAPALWDVASPTSWMRDAIWGATELGAKMGIFDRAYDPFESWVKPLAGDWAGVRACADVWDSIALALEDMSGNLRRHALGVDGVWGGNAADALISHCWYNGEKILDVTTPMRGLAARYRESADAMFEIGKVMGSLIADLCDAAMIFISEASLAAATSETIVGGVVFGGAAIYEGYKIWDIVKECLDLVGRADSLTSALSSAGGDFGLIGDVGNLPILTGPLDLPIPAR
ncbi:hypothetical protein [Actinoplanes sp. NPDC049118]|uniref:hypothetical protein n=1 Tax=Actinoplanes sp. NPDC049118 TaxID=3155769 RepID=UPI00340615D0